MKSKDGKGRLVTLLAKGFLGFTAAVLAVTFFSVWLSNAYYEHISNVPDVESLRTNQNLLEGNYEKVPIEKYLGKEGAFAVLSADGTVLYRSSDAIADFYTGGELACIASYDETSYVEHTSFTSRSGTREHLFIRYVYDSNYNVQEQVMILNDNYEVVGGGFDGEKKIYTAREVDILQGDLFPDFDFFQCRLNEDQILLILTGLQDMEYYNTLAERANRIFLVVIPLYAVVLAAFLMWISRQIKNPLVALNRVMELRSRGDDVRAGELKGPWEIRQIGRTFDRMTERLEASERERQRLDGERQKMLAAISHDLKTPITVISGYASAIRDGKVEESKIYDYLDRIDGKASELNELVNSFHEFSKVEHPDFSIQAERTDICEFLRSYLADRYNDIEFHGFTLRAVIPDDYRTFAMIDAVQMRRALDNLLYNTLRHNRLGTVLAVGVSRKTYGTEGLSYVRIFIADDGLGIPTGLRDKIFEPFSMGDDSRRGKGSGLGLSITKNIIHFHDGEIRLCSTPQNGYSTEFEILLKMAE